MSGNPSYGSYVRGDMISLGGATSRVSKNGNGITTTRTDNGERISYSRSGWSGEWNNGGWNNGNWGNSGGGSASIYGLDGKSLNEGSLEMARRGFRQVNISRAGNTTYVIYWRAASGQCVQGTIYGDRFSSVNDIGSHSKCR